MDIVDIDPDSTDAQQLITDLDDLQSALYPAESNHLDSAEELSQSNVHFLGAREDGVLLGCGAVKLLADPESGEAYAEIKRMFVSPAARGKGVAKDLMIALEDQGSRFGSEAATARNRHPSARGHRTIRALRIHAAGPLRSVSTRSAQHLHGEAHLDPARGRLTRCSRSLPPAGSGCERRCRCPGRSPSIPRRRSRPRPRPGSCCG